MGAVILRRWHALAYSCIDVIKCKLPRSLWRLYFSPIISCFRQKSPSEEILINTIAVPKHDTCGNEVKSEGSQYSINVNKWSNKPVILSNVYLLSDGTILEGKKISIYSSLYGLISLHNILHSAWQLYSYRNQEYIKEATFIPRQLVSNGTYGDYFIECLIPLANMIHVVKSPLLTDSDFTEKYIKSDIKEYCIDSYRIPASGLLIEKLQVIPPIQCWDNFTEKTLRKLTHVYPCKKPKGKNDYKKIYLSRVGVKTENIKIQREIKNEIEIECYLQDLGYSIIRTVSEDNLSLREKIQSAVVVVGTHGAAFCHLPWGNPDVVVEIKSSNWWIPCYSKMCVALSIKNYYTLTAENNIVQIPKLANLIAQIDNKQVS